MQLSSESRGRPAESGLIPGQLPPRQRADDRPPRPLSSDLNWTGMGKGYLRIPDVDRMAPFLMSVVSDSDLWLFVGSNGGFTAGRTDPDHAIFPYRIADRILDQPGASGVLSLLRCDGLTWQPWDNRPPPGRIRRNLYKHEAGTSVVFEEIHPSLALAFRWELSVSGSLGLVRSCELQNIGNDRREVTLLDGWHHVLPAGVRQETYSRFSYLAAAYMRHESVADQCLAIHTLNSGITDRAEPSESLRVACTWSVGLDGAQLLICDRQVDAFRRGLEIAAENEARGVFGAHLLTATVVLQPGESKRWTGVADTGLDHADVVRLRDALRSPDQLEATLRAELAEGVVALKRRIAGAGAIQQSADRTTSCHHFANVLFNCMRGGTLHDNYGFPRADFEAFLESRNRIVHRNHREWLAGLPDPCTLGQLRELAAARGDFQLSRLAGEYLPICFSRRHGDPSRPWNRFEIHTRDQDGRPLLGYAGNWRDIFQNWESLAYSYPACFESMIALFLNSSTADGYNPYRITRAGIDWEVYDATDPWSHIGYWGDHQIIYLLRLLEGQERFYPGSIASRLAGRRHSYAHVPYEIRGFDELLADPKQSIRFNGELHDTLMERSRLLGGDGKLLVRSDGSIMLVTLAEKLLVPLLAKLGNLVPGGGIWLNTQRPEWNDANNALAGWGLSVVTVGYIRRYLVFLRDLLAGEVPPHLELTVPVAGFLARLAEILPLAAAPELDDAARFALVKALGRAGEEHRKTVYSGVESGFVDVPTAEVRDFIGKALAAIDATLASNRREDRLFHSYNLMEIAGDLAVIHPLDPMLEGQVSALSSGTMRPDEAVELMTALRASPLYREDQKSYFLYPDREIVPFLQRNTLPAGWQQRIPGVAALAVAGDREILRIDKEGNAHFHPDLSNARDLDELLDRMAARPDRRETLPAERGILLDLWEEVFQHRFFTGRSVAMFGFEGLGCVYWHMIAKLLLAVQESHRAAMLADPASTETRQLGRIYGEVREGLGFMKSPAVYGAFPTDPYSHTPRHAGAQQPGMTGQVKEEILTRMGELGVQVGNGCVEFNPRLLGQHEFFADAWNFDYIDIAGQPRVWPLPSRSLAFTLFQVPVCYRIAGTSAEILLEFKDGAHRRFAGHTVPLEQSAALFARDGSILAITVSIPSAFTP